MMTRNHVLNYMLQQPDMPLTVEKYVGMAYMGQKTLTDLEGEELAELQDFRNALDELEGRV